MKRLSVLVASILLLVLVTPPAQAYEYPDLAGTWQSSSLTQNGFGYALRLKSASRSPEGSDAYNGRMRFRAPRGRTEAWFKVGLAIGESTKDGFRVTMVLPGGSIASGRKTVNGQFFSQDGSMYFPKCTAQLPRAMKGQEDTDCRFQQLPRR
jgi:hypothetical protein